MNAKKSTTTNAKSSTSAARKEKKKDPKIFADEDILSVVHPNAAGIDLGARQHWVAVSTKKDKNPVRPFGPFTEDLENMVKWLKSCGVTHVAMEATGVYWMPVYTVLDSHGFNVTLADPRSTKHVAGRKSDVSDCQWIQRQHMFGNLRASFVPPGDIIQVRDLFRYRKSLAEDLSREVLHMQKAMDRMNIHLHKVVSDITGVSAMKIVRAIAAGTRSPEILAGLVVTNLKASKETLMKALTGTWDRIQIFLLNEAIERYDYLSGKITHLDKMIEKVMKTLTPLPPREDEPASSSDASAGEQPANSPKKHEKKKPKKKTKPRRSELSFDAMPLAEKLLGVDVTDIEGIGERIVLTVISEYGLDLSAFPTAGHFASHLGLTSNNKITGGKILKGRTRKVASHTATAFRNGANSLHSANSGLGGFLRRLKARAGSPKAITATAHKLAERYYMLVMHGKDYVQQTAEEYDRQFEERRLAGLIRNARKLNLNLVDPETGECLA